MTEAEIKKADGIRPLEPRETLALDGRVHSGIRTAERLTPTFQPGNYVASQEPASAQATGGEFHRPMIPNPRLSESTAMEAKPVAPRGERPTVRVYPGEPHEYLGDQAQPVQPVPTQVQGQIQNVAVPDGATRGSRNGAMPLAAQDTHLETPSAVTPQRKKA